MERDLQLKASYASSPPCTLLVSVYLVFIYRVSIYIVSLFLCVFPFHSACFHVLCFPCMEQCMRMVEWQVESSTSKQDILFPFICFHSLSCFHSSVSIAIYLVSFHLFPFICFHCILHISIYLVSTRRALHQHG